MPESTRRPFTTSASIPEPDLIFVLGGLESRKSYALGLLQEHRAPRILLSVGRFEIRKLQKFPVFDPLNLLQVASSVAPPLRHYFVWLEGNQANAERIPIGKFGTLSEIRALSTWLEQRPELRTVLIISSGYHLLRIRLCCLALLPQRLEVRFAAAPESDAQAGPGAPSRSRMILGEIVKIPIYAIVLAVQWLRRKTAGNSGIEGEKQA